MPQRLRRLRGARNIRFAVLRVLGYQWRIPAEEARMRNAWKLAAVAAAVGLLAMEPGALSIAGTGKAAHANIAIVHIHDGSKPPSVIPTPNAMGLLKAIEGHGR
ncbi:MAG: hypothetical protein D6771_02225, partial [Zetaproteobacteria bacterium]